MNLKSREIAQNSDDLILVYQDEVHFQQQTSVTSKWYKTGIKPKVKSFPAKSKISYSGFVIPDTGVLFTKSPDRFDYLTSIESVRAFLEDCPVPIGKKRHRNGRCSLA